MGTKITALIGNLLRVRTQRENSGEAVYKKHIKNSTKEKIDQSELQTLIRGKLGF